MSLFKREGNFLTNPAELAFKSLWLALCYLPMFKLISEKGKGVITPGFTPELGGGDPVPGGDGYLIRTGVLFTKKKWGWLLTVSVGNQVKDPGVLRFFPHPRTCKPIPGFLSPLLCLFFPLEGLLGHKLLLICC